MLEFRVKVENEKEEIKNRKKATIGQEENSGGCGFRQQIAERIARAALVWSSRSKSCRKQFIL
jgi:hypothetical protein